MKSTLKGGLTSILFIAYPLIIYLLLTHELQWLGSCLILCLFIWVVHRQSNGLIWIIGILVATFLLSRVFGNDVIAKLSPLMIHSGLFYLFWGSLKTTPLIEQFARLDFPELPPEIQIYTRQLTKVWSAFFATNIIACLWLAIANDNTLWALYNGLIVYLLMASLMLGEYIWRRIRFPDLEIPPPIQSIRNIIKNGHKIWGPKQNEAN